MNIDLKGFTETFYRKLGGDLETVKQTIALASQHCHLEVTTLIVPVENDSPDEMDRLSGWLSASARRSRFTSRGFSPCTSTPTKARRPCMISTASRTLRENISGMSTRAIADRPKA